ncbi:recombinase family protein [Kitasatospora sp. NPDC058162]|uniref:recombinase family protein n=1 Tax=Kitasatospora sp. NPDC058162 TaxID=3346362 RepID=UPI0036D8059A
MAFARTCSVALVGVDGVIVEVQADLEPGVAAFTLVGLPDKALTEARDRVRAAVCNSGEAWPQRKLTVGLSPASVPKSGSGFDLSTAGRRQFYGPTLGAMRTHQMEGRRRRVVIYCRISDDREGRRWGVDRQERVCRERADDNGWDVVAVLIENDVSAYSGKRRPKYDELLRMLRDGEADAVLALSNKRLQRQYKDAFEFLDLVELRDIAVDTIKSGRYNLNTAEGRGRARKAAIEAQEESEEIGERVRDAKNDNVVAGTYRGGPRPFGFEADGVTVREDEAQWVRYATRAIIDGESLRSICRTLSEKGVRTVARRKRLEDGTRTEPESREWKPEELRKLLLRARNAGLIEVAPRTRDGSRQPREIVGKAVWPALVDEETWRACKSVLENPARRTTTGNGRKFLGSGIYNCYCSSTMRGSTTGIGGVQKALKLVRQDDSEDGSAKPKTHKPAYRCNASASHNIRDAASLDAFIEGQALARLARPDAAALHLKAVQENPSEDLAAQAGNLRAKLDSIAADYAEDRITRQQMLDMTAISRERLNVVMAKMAGRAANSVLASLPLGSQKIEEAWKGYHIDRRRQIISALMVITVNKARRGRPPGYKAPANGERGSYFDPTTIDIQWKPPA